jgi:hypothetical protein
MNVKTVVDLVAQKSGKQPKPCDDAALSSLAEFLEQPAIGDYLRNCLPVEVLGASDVRLLPLDAIEQEMAEGAAPGSFIRPYGYLVVASSIGGNAVCFHSPSGKVFWADHASFASDCISFKDRITCQWKYIYEYTPENVEKALVLLADDIESFLKDLLADRLTKQLESLD